MDLTDAVTIAFLVGPVFGPFIAAGVVTVVAVMRRSTRVLALAWTLTVVVLVSFVAYWYVWGVVFDDLDAGRSVSPTVDAVSKVAIAASAAGVVALLALVVTLGLTGKPALRR